ncbi:2'-5' RNA ligase family protein [Parasphingopyxis lamellibrachiae]|uniref:2'-5' RNA ligase n=1 Tax=Parasphingopyxis lamellibrachiae TaxID=680125 RepID=A0A3D9FF26_9SPHN|nr:2'-5' RNA ligase family protein [Parasphingopyxis lamellibrachiae]RED15681.1 2'-5' RNA ligase [Parasphingopyxis lamellibrachiae]
MTTSPAPIIVTAVFGKDDFAHLDALRKRYYPADRNRVQAHLTLFHHLPPSVGDELKFRLNAETRGAKAPRARLSRVMSLGQGVALGVESPDLMEIRDQLADAFAGLLMPQDRQPWRPHITIQNKVASSEAKALLEALSVDFEPRPLRIAGLSSWYYRGGQWELLAKYSFVMP